MPTMTYDDSNFHHLNLGLECVPIDLSSGENQFDLNPVDLQGCLTTSGIPPQHVMHFFGAIMDGFQPPTTITLPQFSFLGGRLRINRLAKRPGFESASLAWSAEHGGSVLLAINFESEGSEILGRYHGQINDGRLFMYLALKASTGGQLLVTPVANFSGNIDISNVSNYLERGLRAKIRGAISRAFMPWLQDSARNLTEMALRNMFDWGPDGQPVEIPVPPIEAFFTQVLITDGSATLSWGQPAGHARVSIQNVDPNFAMDERLRLRLRAGGLEVSRSAQPNTQIVLPLELHNVPVVEDAPLDVHIRMETISPGPPHPSVTSVGTVHRTFPGPGYGAGVHQDSGADLHVRYVIDIV